jgi:transposase
MAGRKLPAVILSADERAELQALAAGRKTAQALAMRARVVLSAATGALNKTIAERLGIDPATVGKWRRRFLARRVNGLHDEPRSGAPRTLTDERIEAVIVQTLENHAARGDALEFARHGACLGCLGV